MKKKYQKPLIIQILTFWGVFGSYSKIKFSNIVFCVCWYVLHFWASASAWSSIVSVVTDNNNAAGFEPVGPSFAGFISFYPCCDWSFQACVDQ